MKDFKYKITLASKINIIKSEEQKNKFISLASKSDNINKLLPKNVNLVDNVGFVLFTGESFVANLLNANQDGVGTKEALELAKGVPLTYLDINHCRQHLCGVAIASTFTDYKTGKELSESDVKNMTEPFSVTITGIVWVAPNPELAEAIQDMKASDSPLKDSVYLSWELAFSSQNLILLDPQKDKFSEGKIISDTKQIDKLLNKLISNGGNGLTDDGLKIGRIPIDDVTVLGFGLVENPAAAVNPIEVRDNKTDSAKDTNNASKEIDTIEAEQSNYPKPIKKLYKKFQKSKLTEEEFSEALGHLIEAYSIAINNNVLEYSDDFGKCPTCNSINPVESTRYDNGKIFCGSCGTLSLGSKWVSDKKIKINNNNEDIYKLINFKINNGNINNYKEMLAHESHAHKTVKCSCGNIISNCRCASGDKKVEIVDNGCKDCLNNQNKISQAEKLDVIPINDNIISNMKIEKIEQLTDENLKEVKSSDLKELFASSAKTLVEDGIKKISDDFAKKLSDKENEVKAANDNAVKLQTSVEEINKKLSEVTSNYEKIVAENKQKEAVEAFSARMEAIEKDFDLDDKQKEIVANKVKSLENDDAFTKYLEEINVLLAAKKKAPKKDAKDAKDGMGDDDSDDDGDEKDGKKKKTEAKASVADDKSVADALKNGKQDDKNIIPNAAAGTESLADRAKKAFGIEGWAIVDKRKNRIN